MSYATPLIFFSSSVGLAGKQRAPADKELRASVPYKTFVNEDWKLETLILC